MEEDLRSATKPNSSKEEIGVVDVVLGSRNRLFA